MIKKEIAVIGMSCRFNTSNSVYSFHRALLNGNSCKCGDGGERAALTGYNGAAELDDRIAFINEIEYFDNKLFGISDHEALRFSPELRIALELAVLAALDGGYPLERLKGMNCGVIASISGKGYRELCEDNDVLSEYGSSTSMAAGYIAHYLGVEGPVMMTDSDACSAAFSITAAVDMLCGGTADMILAGGAELALFSSDKGSQNYVASLASDNECVPYSKKAGGTVTGEGGGFVLLKRLDDAIRDGDYIYGRILGYSCGSSGMRDGLPYLPDADTQLRVIGRAWENAGGIIPEEFEGGAIGIASSDKEEVKAFSRFSEGKAVCSSVRHTTGHLGHLCCLASVIKTMLSYKNRVIYPLGAYASKGMIKAGEIVFPDSAVFGRNTAERYTGINSFGANGACVHIAAGGFNGNHKTQDNADKDNRLVVLSARSEKALSELTEQLEDYLVRSDADINDVIYTLNARRTLYPVRYAVFCSNRKELIEILSSCRKTITADMNEIILLVKDSGNIPLESAAGRFLESGLFVKYIAQADSGGLDIRRYDDRNVKVEYKDISAPFIVSTYENALADMILSDDSYEEIVKYCACSSAEISWEKYYDGKPYRNYPMPGICFDKKRFWPEISTAVLKTAVREKITAKEKNEMTTSLIPAVDEQELMDTIRELWTKHLELTENIEYDDNFFELGGNSLTGGMALAELKERTGVDISFTDMYENPTISAITRFYLKRT